ncbi:MAG: protein kinase [Luteitalea sp.]|nr:protein kinase [Luteitalea sp.]
MADDKPTDNTLLKRLHAFYTRLVGETPSAGRSSTHPSAGVSPAAAGHDAIPARIGRYAIERKLGQGGMGVVYAARDQRLERRVALKMLSSLASDETARKRFWREARLAASISHPNVCQLYEIGEDAGELFIAMELLEGESLAERVRRGPLSVAETVPIGLEVLAALSALHARDVVHRDLKPSNVFLTPHGVKLLDFGLARTSQLEPAGLSSATELTRAGVVVGTPRYMAPEQVTGEALDPRADLFAVGAMLFEMLAGRPAFTGRSAVEILHATLYEQPPALTGPPAVAAADRVIRRALAKRPSERPASALVMAEELRAVAGGSGADSPALARPLTRLVVLPFRVLRPDPETDFLAFSLPDAVATSLSGISSLVVRSSATAARVGSGESPDLKTLAAEADVDLVVMGTLLRSGDQLRAAAQLVEAPAGTLLTSHTAQAPLGDLFRLQDDLAKGIVEGISLPLAGREAPTPRDVPRSARAYEFYLRANELAREYDQFRLARDLYLRSLDEDSTFAPAWARLGRCHRVIGKYFEDPVANYERAEQALQRALELSPDLSVAHKFYAHLEAETGHGEQALTRLLGEASRRGNDPELFAGLVHACRYCGLLEQSIAAHEEAKRLDPNVPTGIENTLLMSGDLERLLKLGPPVDPDGRVLALGLAGRQDEAREALHQVSSGSPPQEEYRTWLALLEAWIERRPDDVVATRKVVRLLYDDPEALFTLGWLLCDVGLTADGLELLQRAVAGGFYAALTLTRYHHFDVLRSDPVFQELVRIAEARRQEALTAFRDAGGERLLGV